ncbi:Thiamine phosphate synthase [Rhodovastum atsumiense]|uniref:Thiamine phosphate synthase n=1 Tax=Rhodovastum atsumiense TaxID=504468 RepID=A0A5M6IQ33_9PROT|nr:thiamine phosphate synthase [Rhodovastum atsumiense]KAA5610366.1 thiamine phosphate synthase [Rhodovastum atsumiense]CAH2600887.1 Thiamine phosphate synthase [Rhodovastum atsumiense]
MDKRLVGWARAVKSRQRWNGRARGAVLWLFTDARRLPDPLPAVARLPRGLAGVVLRHDEAPERAALGRAVARLCRRRGLALAVAGDWRLAAALRAGLHLRGGRRPAGAPRWMEAVTSSVHGVAELLRARRMGALAFLSPVFPTASHPGGAGLGPCRWGLAVRRSGGAVAALGGMTGDSVRRLRGCVAAGAIGGLR